MILVDAGPLVAILDSEDQYHERCVEALRATEGPLATLWPNVTEAMYHLLDLPQAQETLLTMLSRDAFRLLPLGSSDIPRIRDLMRQYANRPMDLADAALIRVAEREGIRTIFTVDRRDFEVYRLHGRIRPRLIP